GPSSDGRLKPDVVAPGNPVKVMNPSGYTTLENGTSFSAPLTASLAAGLWEAFPNLTNSQLRDIIKASASFADAPNNSMGFGVPYYPKAKQIAKFYANQGFVTVFPNPCFPGDEAYLRINPSDLGKNMEVSIFDSVGKLIKSEIVQNSPEINWLNLDSRLLLPGCYVLKAKFSDKTYTFKFIHY
ncbi:MAG: S8 family peptidase, partial [Cytophagales bacterium]|nr:S8 family peptidase [Cytophagales bacterium]